MKSFRYLLVAMLAVGIATSADSETCAKLVTYECDEEEPAGPQVLVSTMQGPPGKRGLPGPIGPKGEPGGNRNTEEAITALIRTLENRLGELERECIPKYRIQLTPRKGTYSEAQVMCAEMNGQLVHETLLYENQQDYQGKIETLLRSLSDEKYVWVGATDEVNEGVWLFENGEIFNEDFTYYKWDTVRGNEPNGGRIENYLTIAPSRRTFNDYQSDQVVYGLCEIQNH